MIEKSFLLLPFYPSSSSTKDKKVLFMCRIGQFSSRILLSHTNVWFWFGCYWRCYFNYCIPVCSLTFVFYFKFKSTRKHGNWLVFERLYNLIHPQGLFSSVQMQFSKAIFISLPVTVLISKKMRISRPLEDN